MKKIILFFIVIFMPWSFAGAIDAPSVLSDSDAEIYSQIFALQSREKIDSAIKLQSEIDDTILINDVLFDRYVSKTYRTRGLEVSDWMQKYYDMPGADRMVKLAALKKTNVRSAKLPTVLNGTITIESAQSENWTAKKYPTATEKNITKFKRAIRSGASKTARVLLEDSVFKKQLSASDYGRLAGRLAYLYYTNGEYELAEKWGIRAADANSEYGLWAMGLLSFRSGYFSAAQKYFGAILGLGQINDARKTEAAFWAGRAAYADDNGSVALEFWRIAAARPMSFYGALASVMLGYEPRYEFFEQEYDDDDIAILADDKYGRRALALIQVGQKSKADEYLRLMITRDTDDRMLHAVNVVSNAYGLPRSSMQAAGVVRDRGILEIDSDIIYSAQYPLPDWEPLGGWSIDRALLFAITKQESNFKTGAKSGAGAGGVMQLMPNTAKMVAKRADVKMSDIDITNPEHNMFLGQQYIVDLLGHKNVDNNIIKMLASYNAGIATMLAFEEKFETSDPLLYIESFPAYETRNYIKRVMSNLWLYRAKLGQPLTALDELADGRWPLYNSEDEYVQNQIEDRMSI